jgi:surfeit locus 1 family protein
VKPPSTPSIAAFAVLALTASLGVWQLQRADEKALAQAMRDAALATPPLRLDAAPIDPDTLADRRVELVGRFDTAGILLLDNRTHRGVAGFHVLTPLRLDEGGRSVMVLRGWVARDVRDRTRPLAFGTPAGTVRVEGLALRVLPQPRVLGDGADAGDPGTAVIQHFDLDAWRRTGAPDAAPVVVRQTSALDDGLVREWVQPGAGVDRHRGYAVQWFAMSAATAVAWWALATRRRQRPRPYGRP